MIAGDARVQAAATIHVIRPKGNSSDLLMAQAGNRIRKHSRLPARNSSRCVLRPSKCSGGPERSWAATLFSRYTDETRSHRIAINRPLDCDAASPPGALTLPFRFATQPTELHAQSVVRFGRQASFRRWEGERSARCRSRRHGRLRDINETFSNGPLERENAFQHRGRGNWGTFQLFWRLPAPPS